MIAIYHYNKVKNLKYVIAIIQSASHPALDSARDGFIEALSYHFSDQNIEFLLYNSQGSLANAHALASQLIHNNNINMFYTIGSSVTQAISQLEKRRPIIFAAVSDAQAIGIEDGKNVTGISDMIAPEIPLYLINSINKDIKKVGLFYSMSTLNQRECAKIKQILENNHKEVINIIVNNESEIEAILEANLYNIDALLSPCDNIIAMAMPFIAKKMIMYKKPYFVCFNEAIKGGALGACGADYYESGKENGYNAVKVIKKEIAISRIPIKISDCNSIYLNQDAAKSIDLDIKLITNNNIVII